MEMNKISIKDFGSKFQTKNEIYRFLVTEVDMHCLLRRSDQFI